MRVLKFLYKQIKLSFFYLLSLWSLALVIIPLLFKKYVWYQGRLVDKISQHCGFNELFEALIGMIVFQAAHELVWRLRDLIKIGLSSWSRLNAISQILPIIANNEPRFFESSNVSAAVANARQIAENTERILSNGVKLLSSAGYVIISLYSISEVNMELFGSIMIGFITYVTIAGSIFAIALRFAADASDAKDMLLVKLYNTFINMQVIFIYKTFQKEEVKILRKAHIARIKEAKFEFVLLIAWLLQTILFLWMTWRLMSTMIIKRQNAGAVTSIINYMKEFFKNMWSAAENIGEIIENFGRLGSSLVLIDQGQQCDNHGFSNNGEALIVMNNVTLNTGETILRFPNLKIKPDETVFLLGPSGSGKSSMIEVMLGLTMPTEGKVHNGLLQRARTAYIPQTLAVFDATMRENLLYGLNIDVTDEEIKDILSLGVFDFVFQRGLNSSISNSSLSGGEIQKIFFARALIRDKKYGLLLTITDEPTSALDEKSRIDIINLLKKLSGTKIIVTHNYDQIASIIHPSQVIRLN